MDDSQERFERLYRASRARLAAYALRRAHSSEEAADVVGETFAIAWRRVDDLPGEDEVALLWLYATARRVLANSYRRTRARADVVRRLGEALALARRDEAETLGEGVLARSVLDRLDDADRELLMLVAWEGLGAAELATVLGCSPTAARIRLHRARSRLRRELAEADMEPKQEPVRRHLPNRPHTMTPTEEEA